MKDLTELTQSALQSAGWASRMKYGGEPMCEFVGSFEMQRGEYQIIVKGGGESEDEAVQAFIQTLAVIVRRQYAMLPTEQYLESIRVRHREARCGDGHDSDNEGTPRTSRLSR